MHTFLITADGKYDVGFYHPDWGGWRSMRVVETEQEAAEWVCMLNGGAHPKGWDPPPTKNSAPG